MHGWQRLMAASVASAALAACGGVTIAPEPVLPRALVQPIGADVGYVLTSEQRNYVHSETRAGVPWKVSLGSGHQKLMREIFTAEFRQAREFPDFEAARKAENLQAVFEPKIEQYSFATASETGGMYVAVTIRYRIDVHTPEGARFDSLTLTGYGASLVDGIGSEEPMAIATRNAMRDAAAKFLAQFQGQPLAEQLAKGEKLVAASVPAGAVAAAVTAIEAVPIRPSRRRSLASLQASPST